MSAGIPELEPREFTVGESLAWLKTFADYSPADGWILSYYFRGPTTFDVVATADGDDFVLAVSTAVTDLCLPGTYSWQAWVENDDGEKHCLESGATVALPGLPTMGGNYDARSKFKQILDAIDDLVAGKATIDQQQYTIGTAGSTRMLSRIPIPELLELRKYFAAKVARENRKGKTNRIIFAQFD